MDESHIPKIQALSEFLENRSLELKSSKANSVAAATVYLYLCKHPDLKNKLGLNKSEYAKIVGFSEITIKKLATVAATAAGHPKIVI